jgi:hypothetical protein
MPALGGHPGSLAKNFWIPAFAGMTGLQEKNSTTPELNYNALQLSVFA